VRRRTGFPAGFRKSLTLFNLHRAIATKTTTAIIVEGFVDAIAVHQAGYPAVALMGSALSHRQADLVCAHFDNVLLMLDGDEAGRQGATVAAHALRALVRFAIVTLEPGTQPDQLRPADIMHLLVEHERAVQIDPGRDT
jgi:DNA primase